jgi:DNA-directed RNA polymerase subunit RPC12/RpoP
MPNGHGQRQEDEERLIEAVEGDGWVHFPDPPEWIIDAAKSDNIPSSTIGFEAAQKKYHGDNYVYLAVSSVHGNHLHVFSQKKSEYFETTSEEGTCPNCEKYIKRYEEDDYLTCHRCGWQHKPIKERLTNLL